MGGGGMQPEVATFCCLKGLLVEGGGHQPTYKTFKPKSVLPKRCKDKDGEEIGEIGNQ